MICVTFNLNDPEGTRKVERINDEAEPLDVLCEILLDYFLDKQGGNPDELVDG